MEFKRYVCVRRGLEKDLDEIDKILDEIGKMEGKVVLVRKICYLY